MKFKRLIISVLTLIVVVGIGGYSYTYRSDYQMTKEPLYYIPKIGIVEKPNEVCYRIEKPITFADGKVTIDEAYYYEDLMYVELQLEENYKKEADEIVVAVDGWGVIGESAMTERDDDGYIREIIREGRMIRSEKNYKKNPKLSIIVGEYEQEIELIPIDVSSGKNTTWSFKQIDDYKVSVIPVTPDYNHMGIIIEPKVKENGVKKEVSVLTMLQESISAVDEWGDIHQVIYDKENEFRLSKLEGKRVSHYKASQASGKKIKQLHIGRIIEQIEFEEGNKPSFDIPNPRDKETIIVDQTIEVAGVSCKILAVSRMGNMVTIDIEGEEISETIDGGVIDFSIKVPLNGGLERSGNKITIKGMSYNSKEPIFTLKANGVMRTKAVDWNIKLK